MKNFNLNYKTIEKHMTKILKTVNGGRAILKNLYFNNNYIYACDSSRILKVYNEHNQSDKLLNILDNESDFVSNEYPLYPEIERVIPQRIKVTFTINNTEIDYILTILKTLKKFKYENIKISYDNGLNKSILQIGSLSNKNEEIADIQNKLNLKYIINDTKEHEQNHISLSYLINAFEFMKDFNNEYKKHLKSTNQKNDLKFNFYLNGKYQPILIKDNKNLSQQVIMPLRFY